MKILSICLLALITLAVVSNAQYYQNMAQYQEMMPRYNGAPYGTPYAAPYGARYAAPRGSVQSLLSGSRFNPRSQIISAPVYFAEGDDGEMKEGQLKDLCNRLDDYNYDSHDVSRAQFSEFIRSFGVAFTDERIEKIYAKLNNGRSAGFDLDRFCQNKFKSAVKTEKSELSDAFKQMDKDGSGKLDRKEIRAEMKRRNTFNEEFLDQILKQADKNGDGKIDFNEFLRMAEIV